MTPTARWLAVAAIVSLCACAAPVRREAGSVALSAQGQREAVLAAQDQWSLSGKIAVTDGRDGGSGRIEWWQQQDRYRIEIRAPVSGRTWRLSGTRDHALLEGLDGGPRRGGDAEALLREHVGWTVPIADLVAWARGARGEGTAQIEFDAEARPARIVQRGWTVDYRAWSEGEPQLPRKVFAASGTRRVRLVVERWQVGADGA